MILLLVAVLPADAGRKKKDEAPAPAIAAPAPAPAGSDPFASFDRAGALAKFQGVWYIVSSEYGSIGAVLEVTGSTGTWSARTRTSPSCSRSSRRAPTSW